MNNLFLSISFILLVLSLGGAFCLSVFPKRAYRVKPIYIVMTGTFLSVLAVMLYVDYKPKINGTESTLFLSVFHTIQIMLAGYDFENLYEVFGSSGAVFSTPYMYLAFLFIVSPICTFSFVLSFFKSFTSFVRYLLSRRKDIYVLSSVSKKSLILAESIRKKYPKASILFANSFTDDESKYDLMSEASAFKGIFFKSAMGELTLKARSKKSKITFFAMDENESENVEKALSVIERFRTRKNTELYVFSTSKESELLLDAIEYGNIKVRRINKDRALAYSVIYDKNDLILNHVTEMEGEKILSALIVGFGGYGSEITKALLWCGQLPNIKLKINVIDKDESSEVNFKAQCPEIMKLNHSDKSGDASYSLSFFSGVDVLSYDFNETISKLKNTSIVFVSLGNDELNVETAIRIRILLEREGAYPVIRAVVNSEIKNEILKKRGLKNYKNESYDIETLGSMKARYSYDTIINEELEAIALKHHLAWADNPEKRAEETIKFNEIEYFRDSSAASAIHDIYRKALNATEQEWVIAEHNRWNAYMRTEGYVYSGSKDPSTRNDRAKMHHDLTLFENLTTEEIEKDKRMTKDK